jgi:outer membrane usher protein FimD/PapC
MNYSFSGANAEARNNDTKDSDTYYLNLRSGINLGAWRFRNYSTGTVTAEAMSTGIPSIPICNVIFIR